MKPIRLRLFQSIAVYTAITWFVYSGAAQDAAKPPVPSGNVTLTFWGIASQPWQVMIDDFEKTYPNIKVNGRSTARTR
jgi:ABC-type glycerol-3-phosphate transport system substrate-binding protein